MSDLLTAAATQIKYAANTTGLDSLGHIIKAQGFLARAAAPLAPAPVIMEPDPFDVPSDYFLGFKDDEPYLIGGSPGNPNGVTFTPSAARKWWEAVFAGGLNIGHVRSTLTPGSHVLSPEGLAAAQALGKSSVIYAPEEYNPLGLEVIA